MNQLALVLLSGLSLAFSGMAAAQSEPMPQATGRVAQPQSTEAAAPAAKVNGGQRPIRKAGQSYTKWRSWAAP